MFDLGGFYGLHPALANLHAMYRDGEALAVHAVAGPYRVRSHFEAQDYLESGADHRLTSGWLNRAIEALSHSTAHGEALSIGVSVPLLMRGPATVASWAPHGTTPLDADLYARIAALNQSDRLLERFPVWLNRDSQGRRNRGVFGKRFGFERVPWPDPIRRTCASAW